MREIAATIEVSIGKIACHKNIVELHEVIADKQSKALYLVLELMEGGAILDKSLKKPFPFHKLRSAARDVICGLSYLHSIGVVHRDVKVENLLVHADGTVKLSDFGVSYLTETFRQNSIALSN